MSERLTINVGLIRQKIEPLTDEAMVEVVVDVGEELPMNYDVKDARVEFDEIEHEAKLVLEVQP